MTQISLSKSYAIIDKERGNILRYRKSLTKGAPPFMTVYEAYSMSLRLLNRLKKEFALVSDADQIPLGL